MDRYSVEETIKNRVYRRVPKNFAAALGVGFRVGGNCLNRSAPHDIDVFPSVEDIVGKDISGIADLLFQSKNASTWRHRESQTKIQLCRYKKESLKDLILSFDYSHIQVGAQIRSDNYVEEVYFSEDWVKSKQLETTWYTGSEYPLSSLMRAFKFQKRGDFAGKTWMIEAMKILTDISHRGFADYGDFKDQLDAVDLGLIPTEIDEFEKDSYQIFMNLYNEFAKE